MLHVTRDQTSNGFRSVVCEYELVLQVKIFCLVIGVMEEQRVVYCQDLLLMGQDERFWENIITGDETWCFAYDPATKRQSAEWVGQNSPKPKKLRFKKSRVKTLIVFFSAQKVQFIERFSLKGKK